MRLHRSILAMTLAIAAVAQVAPVTLTAPATPATGPDRQGFIPRWLLLEPIPVNGLTEAAVEKIVKTDYFPNQFTTLPHDRDKVTAGGTELTWHAVNTKLYN